MTIAPRASFVPGDGPCPAELMLVGEAPGRTEDREGRPFCGISGHFLDRFLSRARLSRSQVYVTNLVKYRPIDNADPDPADIARDWPVLMAEVDQVQPRLIGAVGKVAFQALTGSDLTMDLAHGKVHSAVNAGLGFLPVFCLYHPAAGLRSPRTMENCYWDFQMLGEELRNPDADVTEQDFIDFVATIEPEYRILRTMADALEYEKRWGYSPRLIACDTEGHWYAPISIQFSPKPGYSYIIKADTPDLVRWFNDRILPSADPLAMHYAPHDMEVLEFGFHSPIHLLWSRGKLRFTDTAIEGYVSRQEPIGIGLKKMARRHLGVTMMEYDEALKPAVEQRWRDRILELIEEHRVELPPQLTKSGKPKKRQQKYAYSDLGKRLQKMVDDEAAGKEIDWEKRCIRMRKEFPNSGLRIEPVTLDDIPESRFLHYAGSDPDCTGQLRRYTHREVVRTKQENVLETDLGALPMFARMNHVGMMLDTDRLDQCARDFRLKMWQHRDRLSEVAGVEVDPDKTVELRDLLYSRLRMRPPYRTPGGLPSTDEKALALLQQTYAQDEQKSEVFSAIMDYREAAKHLRTYVMPLYGKIRHVGDEWIDGSVSPDLLLTNTATGRAAGVFLTFPAHTEDGKKIRSCFRPRPGKRFVSVDLSQIELRVLAEISGDEAMREAYRLGQDIHCLSASRMFHIPLEQVLAEKKAEDATHRFPAKTVGFAIVFVATAKGIVRTLAAPPPQGAGLQYTLEEGQGLIDGWLDTFPRVRDYQAGQVRLAKRDGFVRGLSGRIRYFPLIWHPDEYYRAEAARGAVNHPIQEGAQYVEKLGMRIWWERYRPDIDFYCEPVLQIHDDIMLEVDEGHEEEAAYSIEAAMVEAGLIALPNVPIEADWHAADDWGSLK